MRPFSLQRKDLHGSFGFSLVELLVVLAVTTAITGMTIFWSNSNRGQVALSVERIRIGQVIQRAKSLAVTTYAGSPGLCGYGVQMDYSNGGRRYFLVRYDDPACVAINGVTGTFTVLETFSLDPNVVFEVGGVNQLDVVVFVPPEPRVMMAGPLPISGGKGGSVYIASRGLENRSSVIVGYGGQVEF